MSRVLPQITRRMLTRSAIAIVSASALFIGYHFLRGTEDVDLGSAETKGWIAAVQMTPKGSKVVIIKPDGSIKDAPDYKEGARDEDPTWRPDGNRLFFSSDREEDARNIFRWNLANDAVMRRTMGKNSRSKPSFAINGIPELADRPLIVSNGMVWSLNPTSTTSQVLVPKPKGGNQMNGGAHEESEGSESNLGAKLRANEAKYFKGSRWIAFIRDTDEGQALMIQNQENLKAEPSVVAAADKISFAVNPATGNLVYMIANFRFPDPNKVPQEMIKDGKAVKPFKHGIFILDPDSADPKKFSITVALSNDDKASFGYPAISPDGKKLVFVVGPFTDGAMQPAALLMGDCEEAGAAKAVRLGQGEVTYPAFSPDGKKLTFVVKDKNERSIVVGNLDGSGFKNLTQGKGNFTKPAFSPQQ